MKLTRFIYLHHHLVFHLHHHHYQGDLGYHHHHHHLKTIPNLSNVKLVYKDFSGNQCFVKYLHPHLVFHLHHHPYPNDLGYHHHHHRLEMAILLLDQKLSIFFANKHLKSTFILISYSISIIIIV